MEQEEINKKIKIILKELNQEFSKYSKEFIEPIVRGEERKDHDFFRLALAQTKVHLLETKYKLLRIEKYPTQSLEKEKTFLNKELRRLNKRIKAFTNRQFPTRE